MTLRRTIAVLVLFTVLLAACDVPLTPTPSPKPTAPTLPLPTRTATARPTTPPTATLTPTTSPPTAVVTLTPTRVPTAAPIVGLQSETEQGWKDFVAQVEAQDDATAQASVDAFWASVTSTRRVPLPLADGVLFLYKGDAQSVAWRGDFSFWQYGDGVEGARVGDTDLWYGIGEFPPDSRTEYQIVLNGNQWILDPANPAHKAGGLGENSVLTMPAFQVTDESIRRAGVPQGALTDWIALPSAAWNGPVNYRVYTPAGYEARAKLPVLYVTDGNDFGDERIGGMQVALDNLIAEGRIQPLIAVFIDARNPDNPEQNRREQQFLARPEDFLKFITDELIPTIDAQYRTAANAEGRGIAGASFGGVLATYAALRAPDVFANLAAFSPAYWVLSNPDGTGSAATAAGSERMSEFINRALKCKTSGVACPAIPMKVWMSAGIAKWDVGDLASMANPLRARGDDVTVMRVQEGHSWGAWSGETDEMLEFLFPSS